MLSVFKSNVPLPTQSCFMSPPAPKTSHLSLGRHIGASLQQQIDDLVVSRPGATMQRRQPVPRVTLHLSAVVKEERNHVGFTPLGGHVHRLDLVLLGGGHVERKVFKVKLLIKLCCFKCVRYLV